MTLLLSDLVVRDLHTLVTPHVEYKLEDAPEHVGREMRKFWREDRHEALSVRVFIGFVRAGREPGAGRGREDLREVRRVSIRAVRRKGGLDAADAFCTMGRIWPSRCPRRTSYGPKVP